MVPQVIFISAGTSNGQVISFTLGAGSGEGMGIGVAVGAGMGVTVGMGAGVATTGVAGALLQARESNRMKLSR